MSKKTGTAGAKQVAFIMMVIAFAWPLIFGLPRPQGGFDDRFIVGLLLVILGLSGAFIYLEQIKKQIIASLKKPDDKD